MNPTLKAAISLLTLGGASAGGYILSNNYNDDAPIYNTKPNSSLRDTGEIFLPQTLGYKFPSIFLSTRAVSNESAWTKKKEQVTDKTEWKKEGFFYGIAHDDQEIIAKIKLSCLTAYKQLPPSQFSNDNGRFLMFEPKWWEVWLMCGVKTARTKIPTKSTTPAPSVSS